MNYEEKLKNLNSITKEDLTEMFNEHETFEMVEYWETLDILEPHIRKILDGFPDDAHGLSHHDYVVQAMVDLIFGMYDLKIIKDSVKYMLENLICCFEHDEKIERFGKILNQFEPEELIKAFGITGYFTKEPKHMLIYYITYKFSVEELEEIINSM